MSVDERNFLSLEKALYFSLGFELLGAIFFLLTALYVVSDKAKADEVTRLEAGMLILFIKHSCTRLYVHFWKLNDLESHKRIILLVQPTHIVFFSEKLRQTSRKASSTDPVAALQ